jgi:predicted phosphodiesterase
MRLLLLSDTHGHLEQIDTLAERTRADAVIHAGDFGLYDLDSVDRLESRELFLRVVHSHLTQEEKSRAKKLRSDEMRDFIRRKLPLSDLGQWLKEGRGFRVPVYAVWGNHEDRVVIEDLLSGRASVPNLHLLHEGASHQVGPLHLLGLGGNVIPQRLTDLPRPIAGDSGKIWTTLAQIGRLAMTSDALAEGATKVFVSHVSPGREPLVEWIAARLGAKVTISGHMGSPWPIVWSEFAVNTPADANQRAKQSQMKLIDALTAPLPEDEGLRVLVKRALSLLKELPQEVFDIRGEPMPFWYKGAFHINLPDAPDGYAVLSQNGKKLSLETFAEGIWL